MSRIGRCLRFDRPYLREEGQLLLDRLELVGDGRTRCSHPSRQNTELYKNTWVSAITHHVGAHTLTDGRPASHVYL